MQYTKHNNTKSIHALNRERGYDSGVGFSKKPVHLVTCSLPDWQKEGNGEFIDQWIVKSSNFDKSNKIGGFTRLAAKIVFDDIMDKFMLDGKSQFNFDIFYTNLNWYIDCAVGATTQWGGYSATTKIKTTNYIDIDNNDVNYYTNLFRAMIDVYNGRLLNGRQYDVEDPYELVVPNWLLAEDDDDDILDEYEIGAQLNYDKQAALLLIMHYHISTKTDQDQDFFNWINLGAPTNLSGTLEISAINIFKASSSMISHFSLLDYFQCYGTE